METYENTGLRFKLLRNQNPTASKKTNVGENEAMNPSDVTERFASNDLEVGEHNKV